MRCQRRLRPYRRGTLIAAVCAMFGFSVWSMPASAQAPLTVRAMFETTRAMVDRNDNAVVVSPDGRRFAVMLITGDIARDGVWAELRVGRLDMPVIAPPVTVARLFTHARGDSYVSHSGSESLVLPWLNLPRWIDDGHLGLLWEDAQRVHQVVSVDVGTREVRYLTRHRSDVLHFSVRPDGALIYGARVPCTLTPTAEQRTQGYVVQARDAFELLYGCGAWMRDQQALYVITPEHSEARAVVMQAGDPVNRSTPLFPAALFSPDGRRALFPNTISIWPEPWAAYTHDQLRAMWRSREGGDESGLYLQQLQQLFVIDVAAAQAKPLWAAPNEPFARLRAAWSPDDRTVLLGPTFLPVVGAGAEGLAGTAVAAVDVRDGSFEVLPVPGSQAERIRQLRWRSQDQVELQLDDACLAYRRTAAGWRAVTDKDAGCATSNDGNADLLARWSVKLEQSLNEPPRFVASDRVSGARQLVLDPNNDLASRYTLGRVAWIERNADGHPWHGRLYYPADYQPGRRYPLVIQTHSLAGKDEFSLTSRGGVHAALGPGGSVYIAQPLANRGFFVLHGRAADVMHRDGVAEVQVQIAAAEAVVETLIAAGLVDRSRVGIMGFSATGWEVAYAISHPKFPYAAALTDDNKDGGYLQAAFGNWFYGMAEQMIGAPAFGDGLKVWLEHSPAFNVHRIKTPLLMTLTSDASMTGRWELFSRLRYLRKPVEFYVIPDLAHGSHALQNPTQVLALQERALDWWCFWLKQEEDPAPGKVAQYAGWQVLRERQRSQGSTPGKSRDPR